MRRKGFTKEQQSIGLLREAGAGRRASDLFRRQSISEQTFCRSKAQYDGLSVSEARRLRQLEHGNLRLKRLVADLTLDNQR
jgi:putative transposase